MKKVFSAVVALALVGSITAAASAANSVWFQTNGPVGQTGGVVCSPLGVPTAGGPGTALDLQVDTTAGGGTCSWPIRMMLSYNGDGTDDGILAWASDLYTDSPGKVTILGGSFAYQSTGTPGFAALNEAAPNGPHPNGYAELLVGKGRARTDGSANGFGDYALMDFTIVITKNQGDTNTKAIYIRNGTGSWGVNDPDFTQFVGRFSFGPNAASDENGAAGLAHALPVIVIRNVPEPATLSLLALGGLALIRRRR